MIMQDLDDAAESLTTAVHEEMVWLSFILFYLYFLLYEATWCTWFVLIQS